MSVIELSWTAKSQKSLKSRSKVAQKSLKSLSKVSQKSLKSLSKVSQKSLKSLSKVAQKSLKSRSKASQKIVSWPRQTDRQCQLLSCPGQLKSYRLGTKRLSFVDCTADGLFLLLIDANDVHGCLVGQK